MAATTKTHQGSHYDSTSSTDQFAYAVSYGLRWTLSDRNIAENINHIYCGSNVRTLYWENTFLLVQGRQSTTQKQYGYFLHLQSHSFVAQENDFPYAIIWVSICHQNEPCVTGTAAWLIQHNYNTFKWWCDQQTRRRVRQPISKTVLTSRLQILGFLNLSRQILNH